MVTLLNEYFREMVEVVFAHSGTLDKFIGDALMATWGGLRPANREEDARNAVLAALKMKERLVAINERRAAAGVTPWGTGIGISYGPAIFGNIGSHERMDMTVIGDTVNLASRIEGLTRIYGCDILVDERIARKAREICPFLEVDVVRVKGRKKPERLYLAPQRGTSRMGRCLRRRPDSVPRGRILPGAGCLRPARAGRPCSETRGAVSGALQSLRCSTARPRLGGNLGFSSRNENSFAWQAHSEY